MNLSEKDASSHKKTLKKIYKSLYLHFGPQHWWPAKNRFEVIIGAILTQNTSWQNVEKAISNLKSKVALNPKTLKTISKKNLAQLIKPSGYYNIKALRLKSFINWLYLNFNGSISKMCTMPIATLRRELLKINGIGPETADSIILYAAKKPIFVIDTYTKKVFSRHNLIKKNATYDNVQNFFLKNLKRDSRIFNEFHALIVKLAKTYCKKVPLCKSCPLEKQLQC